MQQKLNLVDADTLLSTPIEKNEFIVDGLIPQGVSLLCGSGKIGKSWLMLWLGICVAGGKEFLELPTRQSEVLYLCLEDTLTRIQNRLFELVDEAPSGLRFTTMCGKLGEGLETQILDAIRDFPQTKLIIIDTLQKVRNTANAAGKSGIYANDYDDISSIKRIADENKIAIILVHHLRKMKDNSDPFNEISGSTGITGAADTNLILKRDRGKDRGILLVNGRDVEFQKYVLGFENQKWSLIERKDAEDIRKEEIPRFLFRLVAFMKNQKTWSGTATELTTQMNESETSVNVVSKLLAHFSEEVLVPNSITYSTKRTGKSRLIFLQNDAYDDNDDLLSI